MNERQNIFVHEYIVDWNATKAAIRAGYSEKTAYQQGSALLKIPEVFQAVYVACEQRSKRAGVTADRVVIALADIAFSTDDDDIKTSDRLKALELLGKHLALFVDRVDVNMNQTAFQPATIKFVEPPTTDAEFEEVPAE